MIKVGVNENVIVAKAEINDKGTLIVGVKELGVEIAEKKELTLAEQLAEGDDTTGADGFGMTNFLMFMPNLIAFDKDENGNDVPAEGKDVLAGFIDLKNQLAHWLKRFMTAGQIKFSPFAGVAVDAANPDDIYAKIVIKANAEKMYSNYITQFVTQITPFLNQEAKTCRLFLHRKSEASHFGVLRKKFLENQPFLEDNINIPIEASKMYTKQVPGTTTEHEPIEKDGIKYVPNFSSYELKKKLDSTAIIEQPADPGAPSQDVEAVTGLFSGTGEGADGGVDASTLGLGDATFKIEE